MTSLTFAIKVDEREFVRYSRSASKTVYGSFRGRNMATSYVYCSVTVKLKSGTIEEYNTVIKQIFAVKNFRGAGQPRKLNARIFIYNDLFKTTIIKDNELYSELYLIFAKTVNTLLLLFSVNVQRQLF